MTVGQMAGEVIRAEHRQYAVRPMAQRAFRLLMGAGARVVRLHGNGDLVDHRLHFRLRLPAWLAGFACDGLAQFAFMLLQLRGKGFYRSDAPKTAAAPGGKSGARGVAGGGHLLRVGGVAAPQRGAVHRIGFAEARRRPRSIVH